MFTGVLTLSYIGETFYKMMDKLTQFEKNFEEVSELNKFLNVLKKFNHSKRLPLIFENKIIEFFDYKWRTDKNYCI